MIKADIVKSIGEALNLKDREALKIVDSIIDSIKEIVVAHGRIEIRDFGVFQIKTRKQRVGRNPKNKVEYSIPSRKVVTFKAGKEVRTLPVSEPETATAEAQGDSRSFE